MGRMDSAHLQKMETMMHSKLSKMTLSKNLGRDAIAKCSAQLLCEISTRASELLLLFPILPFLIFSFFPPHVTWAHPPGAPPHRRLHETVQFWAFLHFGIYLPIFSPCIYNLHRNAPPHKDFEFVHHMENCFFCIWNVSFLVHLYDYFLPMCILESLWQSIEKNKKSFFVF